MHAMDFYISACRCVMHSNPGDPETWTDLHRLLPCLRQSLGCYVCFNILQDPMGPTDNVCKHSVCRQCVGGKMKLKPACSWCKDHWYFRPNTLQNVLVKCFKKLCLYILSSHIGDHLGNNSLNGQSNNMLNILKEVAGLNESELDEQVQFNNVEVDDPVPDKPDPDDPDPDDQDDPDPDNQDPDEESSGSLIDKPGCSSDEDRGRFLSGSECEENAVEETKYEPVIKLRRTVTQKVTQLPHDKLNGVSRKTIVRGDNKRVSKTVVFFKRASENKKSKLSQSLKKKALKQSACLRKRKVSYNKNKSTSVKEQEEAPNDLEKMDFSEPNLKKIKQELPPPELKPLTSCKCGKSGNSNQLTCLGQRCQCYSMKLPCIGCKCKGCRNPKKGPDSNSYPTSGIYGTSYLRSGTKSLHESMRVSICKLK